MMVLVIIEKSPTQRYLIKLYTKEVIDEVKKLISKNRYPQAMTAVFTKGSFKREVFEEELPTLEADLILSNKTAHWDLAK